MDIKHTNGEFRDGEQRYQVALYVTCLVDLFRPSVAFDSIQLLERAGCRVFVPTSQTCCGQPSYNSGDYPSTLPLAKKLIEVFEFADYVVVPSASCASMIRQHYPKLLEGSWRDRAITLAAKTFELTEFLADVAVSPGAAVKASTASPAVTYHDGCMGLRELGIKTQPRKLLKQLRNIEVTELAEADVCCGFGGTFCAKMPELSGKMADDKLDNAVATGANILTGADMGCLMNLAGRARRSGKMLEIRHIAEILADNASEPGIAQGRL
ncbi:UNVERIFIED_CONTAM: hypothetical protein GTU68_008130 [Idotea baltica]|nr:hypothetical protein [Idotea baltica]